MDHLHVASQRSRLAIAVSTVVALIAALILVISPSRSLAAEPPPPGDQIYWGNENGALRSGPLGGSASATDVFAGATPCGVAIDPEAGLIYWASWGSNAIQVGNLDGTGDPTDLYSSENGPCGLAIDPAADKIYWASYGSDAIRVGSLDGEDPVMTLFDAADTIGDGPSGVAIDPAAGTAGKIYWSTQDGNQIQVGNLDGTDGVTDLFTGEDNPIGVAIDPVNNFIYWANCGNVCSGNSIGTIRRGNLDGSTSLTSPTTLSTPGNGPAGVAIDPAAGKIYWGTFGGGTIQAGNLDGPPSVTTLFSGESAPNFPAIDPAADKIYWGNENGALRSGPLGGSASATDVFAGETPCGVAIDAAAGKIYWANWSPGTIRVGNLDGTGAHDLFSVPEGGNPCGVAVDPAADKIYWANWYTNKIMVGNLNGSGTPSPLFTEPGGSGPSGVAIDPAAGKIYWTNQDTNDTGQVRVGNLDGTGAVTLFGFDGPHPTTENNPIGVAIAAGKIYWTNLSGQVRVGNLDGSGAQDLFNSPTPGGLAIDPDANTIYWAGWSSGLIQSGPLGGGTPDPPLFSGEYSSLFAAILKTPAGIADPAISEAGGQLSCSQGSWAPDLLGAFLYRAPEDFAYRWFLGGGEIAGETQPTLTPSGPGAYSCEVTASNHAGSTSQISAAFTVSPKLTDLEDTHVWVGLRNSDDQGTRFDVRVELLENGTTVVASGLARCVTGVVRNANQAKEVVVPWGSFGGVTLDPGDVLALRVSTRIGTNATDAKCGGHNNAVGLRLYYDSTTRASRFGATITPNSSANEYLHSDGGPCTSTESAGVTTRTFDEFALSSTTAKCKDSSSINFSGGNPWAVIGTWSRAPQA